MGSKVIEIFNKDGSVSGYRLFSERLPEFLEKYPISQGYRIEVKAADMATVCPGLAHLYAESFKAGINPKDAGLPSIPGGMAFRATLFNKEGHAVANATARRLSVDSYKDFEIGETAARQRLLAALGFGGDLLDQDEQQDMGDQGVVIKDQADSSSSPAQNNPALAAALESPNKQVAAETKKTAPKERPAQENKGGNTQKTQGDVPMSLLRQIQQQAKLLGETPKESFGSKSEAQAELKRLLQLKNKK